MLSARSRGTIQLAAKISARNQPEAINRASWTPFVVDDEWRSAYKHAQTITNGGETDNLLRQCRLHSTMQMADYSAKLPAGDMIECGCCNGHSTVAIATILAQRGFAGRFHVFDIVRGRTVGFHRQGRIGVQAVRAGETRDSTYVRVESRLRVIHYGKVRFRRAAPRLDL